MIKNRKELAVIGGGILGLTTAYQILQKFGNYNITIFEKEENLGSHQTGNNSGVLHCGLYYEPGSLKANLAVKGIREMIDFCAKNGVAHEVCGKIVVATNENEVVRLQALRERGEKNGLEGLEWLDNAALKKREPNVRASKALLVPEEGIVDYGEVVKTLRKILLDSNVTFKMGEKVESVIENGTYLELKTNQSVQRFDFLISCTGLHADRNFANFTGQRRPARIVPFRGEYYELKPEYTSIVNHLVYPVPDPTYPFLGVHFTRMINGGREVGPNAVLAFKREGYKNSDISLRDIADYASYVGFQRFIMKNFTFSMGEFFSSLSANAFLRKAQILIPDVTLDMLVKGTAGVRAQLMNPNGTLDMDFKIERQSRQIHVLSAPSPGATASFAIAEYIVDNYLN